MSFDAAMARGFDLESSQRSADHHRRTFSEDLRVSKRTKNASLIALATKRYQRGEELKAESDLAIDPLVNGEAQAREAIAAEQRAHEAWALGAVDAEQAMQLEAQRISTGAAVRYTLRQLPALRVAVSAPLNAIDQLSRDADGKARKRVLDGCRGDVACLFSAHNQGIAEGRARDAGGEDDGRCEVWYDLAFAIAREEFTEHLKTAGRPIGANRATWCLPTVEDLERCLNARRQGLEMARSKVRGRIAALTKELST